MRRLVTVDELWWRLGREPTAAELIEANMHERQRRDEEDEEN